MRWTKRILGIVAVIAVLTVLVMAFMPQPGLVEISTVTRGSFQQTIDEDGKTRVRERYVVAAPLAGRLQRIELKAGDAVEKGTLLALIMPSMPALLDVRTERELEERLGAAEAEKLRSSASVERAQVALDQANADAARTRKLIAKGFVSPTQLEHDELTVKLHTKELAAAQFEDHAAEHQLEEARAALLRLQTGTPPSKPSNAAWEVLSPLSGRVLKVLHESESDVPLGEALLELADPADLEVVVDVLSTDALQIPPGATVHIERYGGAPLQGRVRLIEPSAFTKVSALGVEEQRVNVLIDITSPREQWLTLGDGYKVDTRIVIFSAENVLKVPVSALFREGDNWAVFVARDGHAQKRTVQIAKRNGLEALVEKGLDVGMQVIVYPGDAVHDGVRIKAR
jgi:HlyD family secretion protein